MIVNVKETSIKDTVEVSVQDNVQDNAQDNINKKNTDPDPPKKKLDKSKAKQWVVDLYKQNGGTISDAKATRFAEHKNVKMMMDRQYRMNGIKPPSENEINNLYNSWQIDIDPVDEVLQNSTLLNPEKKNPNQTNQIQTQSTESGLALEDGSSSLAFNGLYNGDKSYQENVNSIPKSVLTLNSQDAALQLNNILGQYGVDVKAGSKDVDSDGITILRPDGVSETFPIYNESYMSKLKIVNPNQNPEDLLRQRHSDMLSFINASKNDNLTYQSNRLQNVDADNLPNELAKAYNQALIPSNEDIGFITTILGDRKYNDYFDRGTFKYELWRSDVMRADESLSTEKLEQYTEDQFLEGTKKVKDNTNLRTPKLPKFPNLDIDSKVDASLKTKNRKEGLKKLKSISESFNKNKKMASALLGSALRDSKAYQKIDLNNPVVLSDIRQAGIMPGDLPLEQIKINGAPSTVNEISTMLYDYNSIQAIREGKLKIEIGDPKTAGLLADQVSQVKDLMRTQEAYDNEGILGIDNGVTDWLKEAYEVVEGGVTEFGLSSWELMSNISYIGYDSLLAAGVDENVAQQIMYGVNGFSVVANMRSLLDPNMVKFVRQEFQPEYSGDIFDSEGIGEFITKSTKPVAGSMVYTGLFIANPYVGLTATSLGSYGGDRVYQNSRIKELKEKEELGFALSPQEQQMLNQSGAMSRMNSLLKAGVETGVTSLFTFKYFKGLNGVKKFTGPKTAENSKKIADAYAKNMRQTVAGKVSKALGIDKKAVLAELPEENIIALTNYYVDVQFGLDVWDAEKAKKMMKETSLVAVMSGYTMGLGSKLHQKSQIKKIGEQQIKNNINLPAENEAIVRKLDIDSQVNQLEKQAEQGLVNLEDVNYYKDLKGLQIQADNEVQKFDDMKADLIDRMTVNEKSEFLDVIRQLEQQNSNITSEETSNNVKKKSQQNIVELKKKGRDLLSKYPSNMSFYFADKKVQQEYLEKAVEVIGEEKIKNGEKDFTVTTEDTAVFDRAAQLHTQAIADGIVENRQNANISQQVGVDVVNDYLVEIDKKEMDGWNLSNDITNVKNMLSQPELDLTVTKPVDEVKGDKDSELSVSKEGDLTVATGKIEKTKKQINQERTSSIVGRIEAFNLDSDFANDLSEKQAQELKTFFDNVKNGKKVSFGKIESILDAHDIALQIRSNTPNKIVVGSTIKGILKEDGSLTEKGLKLYNNLAQVTSNKFGLNTMTVEGMALIRDSQIGSPLHNLIQEGMRQTAEAKQKAGKIKSDHADAYKAEVIAYNKENKTTYSTDPRSSVDTSYEMSILGMLKRKTGESNLEGQDLEFVRAKKLIIEELKSRKEDADAPTNNTYTKEKNKRLYEEYKTVVERLGVIDAKSFEDVSANALPFNLNAIQRLSEAMPGQRAIDRINDFESYEAFQFENGTYTPIFMSKNSDGSGFSDYFGPSNTDGISANSGKNVTRPETLGTELRLSPGYYWDQAYGQLNGMEMEIGAKKSYETLDNLLQDPTFVNTFEDGRLKDILLNNFRQRSKMFKQDVRNSNINPSDIGDTQSTSKKVTNALYGTISAISLTRLTQPMSQFTSAWAGTYPIIKNSRAKQYLRKRGLSFFSGTAGSFNANNKIGRLFGYFDSQGKLGNIYGKSRTGLRNALASQLAIDPNQSMPADYYIKELKLGDNESEALRGAGVGVKLTIDRVLELMGRSNETALNFMLANSDKAAANMAFEAHYLDYKISQGENVSDLDAFWEKENANPDLEAIKYADGVIDRTMRQSDAAGEAQVYSSDFGKNGMRILMPFQKFILNAKADFSNQIAILQDPNISELQKQDARRFLQGKLNEIVSFNAVKYAGSVATLKGLAGLIGYAIPFTSVDEDDIFEFGGIDGAISRGLPIKSLKEINALEATVAEAETLEERNAALSALSGFREMDDVVKGFEQYAMNYDNKFSTGKIYPVVGSTVQDAIQTLNPLPSTGFMNDIAAWSVNKIYGEDIAREFTSRGFEEPLDIDSTLDMVIKKAGIIGIGKEIVDRFSSAHRLRSNGSVIINRGDYKNQERYLSAPNDAMREQLIKQVDFLYQLRLHSVFNPIAPRADLDKYADRLERTIEKYFISDKPDPYLKRMMGFQGPIQED